MDGRTALIILGILVIAVLLCDRYEKQLPAGIKHLYAAWKLLAHYMGIVMSTIILTILWVIGFGIYAIIFRIIHIPSYWKSQPDTWWIEVEQKDIGTMKQQF